MKKTIIFTIIMGLSILWSCDNSGKKEKMPETKVSTTEGSKDKSEKDIKVKKEDFNKFYQDFLASESFQMNRIKFPLEGYHHDEEGKTPWKKEDWTYSEQSIHEADTNKYKVEINKENNKVTHSIGLKNSGFSANYTYKCINGKWFLTEYNVYGF